MTPLDKAWPTDMRRYVVTLSTVVDPDAALIARNRMKAHLAADPERVHVWASYFTSGLIHTLPGDDPQSRLSTCLWGYRLSWPGQPQATRDFETLTRDGMPFGVSALMDGADLAAVDRDAVDDLRLDYSLAPIAGALDPIEAGLFAFAGCSPAVMAKVFVHAWGRASGDPHTVHLAGSRIDRVLRRALFRRSQYLDDADSWARELAEWSLEGDAQGFGAMVEAGRIDDDAYGAQVAALMNA